MSKPKKLGLYNKVKTSRVNNFGSGWKPVFKKSTRKGKKYSVVSPNGTKIHFGAIKNGIPMDQFKDSTGLKLYSKYDHNDEKRRDNYRARHSKIKLKDGSYAYLDKEQPSYWSWHYLW